MNACYQMESACVNFQYLFDATGFGESIVLAICCHFLSLLVHIFDLLPCVGSRCIIFFFYHLFWPYAMVFWYMKNCASKWGLHVSNSNIYHYAQGFIDDIVLAICNIFLIFRWCTTSFMAHFIGCWCIMWFFQLHILIIRPAYLVYDNWCHQMESEYFNFHHFSLCSRNWQEHSIGNLSYFILFW